MPKLQKLGELAKKFSIVEDDINKKTVSKNVIGFYGCMENTGTSVVLAHVAQNLNTGDEPVVVVDLNAGCPTIYKYFNIDEIDPEASIMKKLRNPTFPATELVHADSLNGVSVISFTGQDVPSDYATISMEIISSLINELASRFSYVLIDLGSNFNDDATAYGIVNCNRVYSFVRPIESQITKLLIMHENFENLGYKNLIYNVIQCQCINNAYDKGSFDELGMKLFGNIDFDYEILKQADNCHFVNPVMKNKNVKGFLSIVDALTVDIKNFVKKSSNTNIR